VRAVSALPALGTGGDLHRREGVAMSEPDKPDTLKALGDRLEQARRAHEGDRQAATGGQGQTSQEAVGTGLRIGLELVVSVFGSIAIGWAIDRWFGTKPWGLLLFLFLGIGVGMMGIYRIATGAGMVVGDRRDKRKGRTGKAENHSSHED
jgi:ATP synthase protein I